MEAVFVADKIKKLIEKGINLSKVVLLTRASFQFKTLKIDLFEKT